MLPLELLKVLDLKIGGVVVKVTEVLRLKSTEKGTKENKEALHDMVMKRLARYVEKEDQFIDKEESNG
ncbi:MAG: hypothetical protein ACRENF_05280 [Thermodesulfobacteriota bacterium]